MMYYGTGDYGGSPSDGSAKLVNDALENERYRVRIDGNGNVSSVYDKKNEKELLL